MKRYDITVIGSGIIGLAIARRFHLAHPDVKIAIVEKESDGLRHQTGRNSGVIHSGIYYSPGSFKAKNCKAGYAKLIEFLNQYDIPFKITGKAIIAADAGELVGLDRLYERGCKNGLDLSYLEASDITEIHSGLSGQRGIWVPETGLTDFKAVSARMVTLLKESGVDFYYNERVASVALTGRKEMGKNQKSALESETSTYKIQTNQSTIETGLLINAAGLQSDRMYRLITGSTSSIRIVPFRGQYMKICSSAYPSDVPIYPVPNPDFPFLGIHITRMLDGTLKVGPNAVLMMNRESYAGYGWNMTDTWNNITSMGLYRMFFRYGRIALGEMLRQGSQKYFVRSVRRYWPEFQSAWIEGSSSGIRAQALDRSGLVDDFVYEINKSSIHILNAPSPAATSSLAIADQVYEIWQNR